MEKGLNLNLNDVICGGSYSPSIQLKGKLVGRGEEVEEVDDDSEIQQQQQQGSSSSSSTVDRPGRPLGSSSSSTVDRVGRPLCTNVHKAVAVDRPVDRLKVPNSRLGKVDRHGRPVPRVGRPTGRPTVGFGLFREIC